MSDLPLRTLFHRALRSADKAADLPTIQDATQELIHLSLSDLHLVHSRVSSLSLFSPNEVLADIATHDLAYLFVPYLLAELEGRIKTTDTAERFEHAEMSQRYLHAFLSMLDNYEVVPAEEKSVHVQNASAISDPARRREVKIAQYKTEKDIKAKIQAARKRDGHADEPSASSDFALVASLLPESTTATTPDGDEDAEDTLREATGLLLRLMYAQAHVHLQSLSQELELLRSAPPPRLVELMQDPRDTQKQEDNSMWRLDSPIPRGGPDGKGPLLDPSGKPLRPFTILPAGSSDRATLQAQVFQPDHRLPSMSVDQYLEIERQRGRIISGGGPQSEAAPTSSEELALDAEMDGTSFGEAKAEEKRQKDESWARYKDTHPKGAGNTMNRG